MHEIEKLSQQQEKIMRLAADGLADKEIAHATGLATGTLRTYWDRMRKKTDSRSRSEIIAKVMREQYDTLRSEYDLQRVLLKSLPFGVWTVTPNGQFEFWNDWFTEYGGMRSSEIAKHGCRALMLPEDLVTSGIRWNKARESGEAYSSLVRLIRANDQTAYWHELRLYPLKTPAGDIEYWCGSAHAIAPAYPA